MTPLQDRAEGSCFLLEYIEARLEDAVDQGKLRPYHQLTAIEQGAMIDLHLMARSMDSIVGRMMQDLGRVGGERALDIGSALGDALHEVQAEIARHAAYSGRLAKDLVACMH